jgi:hypothetical protein
MEADLRTKLEAQKRAIASIDGQPPELALGCVASFPSKMNSMFLNVFDPVEDEPESIQIRIDLDRFLLAYYEPFVAAVDAGQRAEGPDGYIVSEIGPLGLSVGLRESIYGAVKQRAAGTDGLLRILDGVLDDLPSSVLTDGTFVRVGWDDALTTADRYDEESR